MDPTWSCTTSDYESAGVGLDAHGNLFTGDNNSDVATPRWVNAVEGGDSGWRIGWQFLEGALRGPRAAARGWMSACVSPTARRLIAFRPWPISAMAHRG